MNEVALPTPSVETISQAYEDFLDRYPSFRKTRCLDELREREYGRLDKQNHVYLDYTGGGLYADAQLRHHMELLQHNVFGNPHSHNPTSMAMTELVDKARAYVLEYFNTTDDEYVVIFTQNASGALKLVGESYPFTAVGRYVLSADDHNSVNGIREFAKARGAKVTYAPLTWPDLRLDLEALDTILDDCDPQQHNLFAFPAQSNYSGVKHPLELIEQVQQKGWDVLLDCAAFAPTNRLDFSIWKPEFAAFSFYKIFGYPTGMGALLVRRSVIGKLQRPWFAGGTVKIVSAKADGHYLAEGEAAFEDGTINYLNIPAVEMGLRYIESIGIEVISERVRCLTGWLLEQLTALKHNNGRPLVQIRGPQDLNMRGGTITMSFFDPEGQPISGQLIEKLAADENISLRTGCFCNPGAGEATFQLPVALMESFFTEDEGMPFTELVECVLEASGVDVSAVRISVGLVTNFNDVYRFIEFAAPLRDRPLASFDYEHATCRRVMRDTP